jgi:hypothetical protein
MGGLTWLDRREVQYVRDGWRSSEVRGSGQRSVPVQVSVCAGSAYDGARALIRNVSGIGEIPSDLRAAERDRSVLTCERPQALQNPSRGRRESPEVSCSSTVPLSLIAPELENVPAASPVTGFPPVPGALVSSKVVVIVAEPAG